MSAHHFSPIFQALLISQVCGCRFEEGVTERTLCGLSQGLWAKRGVCWFRRSLMSQSLGDQSQLKTNNYRNIWVAHQTR